MAQRDPPLKVPVQPGVGTPPLVASQRAAANEHAMPMAATIRVGTIASVDASHASGMPSTRPTVAESPTQTHSSSAVSPRTTTG
jgi:hypothetical protein|tara:strand:+ start:480 stop:731 length:252 start_codon:yes stop_codon:yes gene_type:complete